MANGYAAASARLDDPPDAAALPDVYEKIPVIRALEDVVFAEATHDQEKELELLRGLVEQEPKSAYLRERLGISLVNLGFDHFEEAEKQLRAALKIEPKSSRSHYALGRIAQQRAERLREEIRRRRDAGETRESLRDVIADERQQTRRTLRSYRTALEFEANYPDAIEHLAKSLIEEGDRAAHAGETQDALDELHEADELLARWLELMPEKHAQRPQVEHNRAWLKSRLEEVERQQ
jgi:Tfp pilus assembly protein PilF